MHTIMTNKQSHRPIMGVNEIVHAYEVFIFDLWGVVHDGITPFAHCVDVMKKLKFYSKVVLILSNSPKRRDDTAQHLSRMGITRELYDGMYTSGEDCYDRLRLRDHPWYEKLGTAFFHIGPEGNLESFKGIGYDAVNDPSQADFVFCSGTDGHSTTVDSWLDILDRCLGRNLPMVCANPDLSIQREGKVYICVGKIAQYYENNGGNVFYHGKPSPHMFERLLAFNPVNRPKNTMVMIGDSLLTDIPGAHNFGIDSLFITSGIHWNERIHDQTFEHFNAFPTWIMDRCSW